jgi:arsenite methyltransferase
MRQQPDYGIDGPIAIVVLIVISGILFVSVAVMSGLGVRLPAGIYLYETSLFAAANLVVIAGGMLWYGRFGKLQVHKLLPELISLSGDESVLDVGCGRGLLLIGAASRLTTGSATGVDVWRMDVSRNRPDAALENARLAGVADRVTVKDGDARNLPFADASFDVVVSALVLHNLRHRADRERALREIVRVLRPGGRVALVDLRFTGEYARVLRECSLCDVDRAPMWRLFSPAFAIVSWGAAQFYRVTGRKM